MTQIRADTRGGAWPSGEPRGWGRSRKEEAGRQITEGTSSNDLRRDRWHQIGPWSFFFPCKRSLWARSVKWVRSASGTVSCTRVGAACGPPPVSFPTRKTLRTTVDPIVSTFS